MIDELDDDDGCVCCGAEIVDDGSNSLDYYCDECSPVACPDCGICLNCCECGDDDE